jgi:hypothetical protein
VSTAGHLRLRDITLSRIPHLRSFVNDALLDVLYFMSPAYHQVPPQTTYFHAQYSSQPTSLSPITINQLTPYSSLSRHYHFPL